MSCALPVLEGYRGLYYYCNYLANYWSGRCLQGGIRSNDDRTPPAKSSEGRM